MIIDAIRAQAALEAHGRSRIGRVPPSVHQARLVEEHHRRLIGERDKALATLSMPALATFELWRGASLDDREAIRAIIEDR